MISDASTIQWKRVASFWVPGEPAPGGSKKQIPRKDGGMPYLVDAGGTRTKKWRKAVAEYATVAWRKPLLDCPIAFDVVFYMPRPKKHYYTGKRADQLRDDAPVLHTQMPDATKLVRSTEDALSGIVWKDDARIARQSVSKVFTNGRSGALINIDVLACHEQNMLIGGLS